MSLILRRLPVQKNDPKLCFVDISTLFFHPKKSDTLFFPSVFFLDVIRSRTQIWKNGKPAMSILSTCTRVHISPFHITSGPDLILTTSQLPSPDHTSHPSHLSLSTHCPLVPSSLHSGGIAPPVVSRLVMILYLLMCWKMIVL